MPLKKTVIFAPALIDLPVALQARPRHILYIPTIFIRQAEGNDTAGIRGRASTERLSPFTEK